MKLMKLRLDVAFRDNAGVMDVVNAIEKSVQGASNDVLAAEVVFDHEVASAPEKRKKRKYVRRAKPSEPESRTRVERRGTIPAGANAPEAA